ncbi:putative P-loop ATPase protein (plasmid) [Streptomyces hygroscopicus subsp. jinggangensis 5008]|nr:putative P-loop ATPase protein [Streptomyces hygroscopicus subsp. jinggangensis 5008]AGF68532.1 putative P-loop ATPase protein [Streptomyces hygroscopicus subsp. jinggangensis TL01]
MTEPENTMSHDAGPRDAEGWKLHDDGTRVHRYGCTIHDGEGCDGHCGPVTAGQADETPPADVTIVSIGRLHDRDEGEWADALQRATIALDLRRHFRDPHAISADLRQLTAHDQIVRDTVMHTPGVREVLAATALQVQGYLAGPTAAPLTVVTQCAGGRHRAATTAMALRAVIAGDVEEAAAYGLADAAKQFTDRDLVVHLVHRDLDKDVVDR